jgi:hypothetical protein
VREQFRDEQSEADVAGCPGNGQNQDRQPTPWQRQQTRMQSDLEQFTDF